MSEPWFRMHANILDKPVTWRLVEATGIHPVKAAGHLAAFWGKVSQHGSHGRVADLPDTQLEAWAGWDGKRGAFATWLRAAHLTDGVVNEYDEYSGALEAHREKTRERVKKWRTERERNAHGNGDVTRTVTVTGASRNDVTIRDDTKREEKTKTSAASRRPAKAKSEPKYPHYPTGLCQALHAKWGAAMEQAIEYTIFRRDTAKAFASPEASEAAESLILDTVELYRCEYENASDRDKPFFTPAKWATNYPRLLRIAALPLSVDGFPTEKAAIVFGGKAA